MGSEIDTKMFALPDLLIPQISRWSAIVFNTLAKDGMFPAGTEGDAIAKQGYCCGYNYLISLFISAYQITMPYLPSYLSTGPGNKRVRPFSSILIGMMTMQIFEPFLRTLAATSAIQMN